DLLQRLTGPAPRAEGHELRGGNEPGHPGWSDRIGGILALGPPCDRRAGPRRIRVPGGPGPERLGRRTQLRIGHAESPELLRDGGLVQRREPEPRGLDAQLGLLGAIRGVRRPGSGRLPGGGPPAVSRELRRLIARRHRTSPNRVLVTTGATEGNFLVNASLVHPRDQVLVDIPIYSPLRDVPRGVGAKVVEIPRECKDGWRLDLDRWRKLAGRRARLLVFANLNNPTSTALSRSDLRALADIAEECDGHVLVDETFRELAFENRPPSAAEFGPRMIALSTVTKVCGLGTLRVGWIVGAPDLLERFAGLKDYTTGGGSIVSQTIASWALG